MEAATKLACNIHRQFAPEVGMAPPDLQALLEEPCRPPPLKRRRGAAKDEGDHEDQDADYGQADEHDEDENEEEEEDDPAPASAGPGLEGDGRAGEKAVEEAVVLPPLHQPAEVEQAAAQPADAAEAAPAAPPAPEAKAKAKARARKPLSVEAKAKISRKSAAYHRAVKAAREGGAHHEQQRAAGRKASWISSRSHHLRLMLRRIDQEEDSA